MKHKSLHEVWLITAPKNLIASLIVLEQLDYEHIKVYFKAIFIEHLFQSVNALWLDKVPRNNWTAITSAVVRKEVTLSEIQVLTLVLVVIKAWIMKENLLTLEFLQPCLEHAVFQSYVKNSLVLADNMSARLSICLTLIFKVVNLGV